MLLCGLTDKHLCRICRSQHGYPDPAVGYWPESCLVHVCVIPEPVGSTHLRFGDARVVMGISMQLPNVVRSPGSQPGLRTTFGSPHTNISTTLASPNLKCVDPTGSGDMQT